MILVDIMKDNSEVVRTVLDHLHTELARQRLSESAEIYAEVYTKESETQEWTDAALSEWPVGGGAMKTQHADIAKAKKLADKLED